MIKEFWAHKLGREAEARAQTEVERLGIRIVATRVRVCGVELDLVGIDKQGGWIVVEVKSLGDGEWIENRLSWRQRQRLIRASNALAAGWRLAGVAHRADSVELWLVLVPNGPGPVQLIQDFT